MKYKIVKETKPTLKTFGKYKAKAVHYGEVGTRQIQKEVAKRLGVSEGDVLGVMLGLSTVISRHLRHGDKVRLDSWGLMKLEIESDKVDDPTTFRAKKHIRGVRLHFLPESEKGKPELYQDLTFEKEKR
jgi:predicted histone-like DNA-binding protein